MITSHDIDLQKRLLIITKGGINLSEEVSWWRSDWHRLQSTNHWCSMEL